MIYLLLTWKERERERELVPEGYQVLDRLLAHS